VAKVGRADPCLKGHGSGWEILQVNTPHQVMPLAGLEGKRSPVQVAGGQPTAGQASAHLEVRFNQRMVSEEQRMPRSPGR
jgi:hypothetical protein